MPLKKPKEFYTLKPNTSLDEVKESATPEKVETISGAFNAFKTNLNLDQKITKHPILPGGPVLSRHRK